MHGEGNSKEEKLVNLEGFWVGVNEGRKKIMVLNWGRSEIVVNSCFEGLEGRMRLKTMWKMVPQTGKNNTKGVEMSSHPGFR